MVSEVLSSIRLIKMFNWEKFFINRIMEVRYRESATYFKFNFIGQFERSEPPGPDRIRLIR